MAAYQVLHLIPEVGYLLPPPHRGYPPARSDGVGGTQGGSPQQGVPPQLDLAGVTPPQLDLAGVPPPPPQVWTDKQSETITSRLVLRTRSVNIQSIPDDCLMILRHLTAQFNCIFIIGFEYNFSLSVALALMLFEIIYKSLHWSHEVLFQIANYKKESCHFVLSIRTAVLPNKLCNKSISSGPVLSNYGTREILNKNINSDKKVSKMPRIDPVLKGCELILLITTLVKAKILEINQIFLIWLVWIDNAGTNVSVDFVPVVLKNILFSICRDSLEVDASIDRFNTIRYQTHRWRMGQYKETNWPQKKINGGQGEWTSKQETGDLNDV